MHRLHRKSRNTAHRNPFDAVTVARWLGILILWLLLALTCSADGLGNPLEREFFNDKGSNLPLPTHSSLWDNPQPADDVPDWRQPAAPSAALSANPPTAQPAVPAVVPPSMPTSPYPMSEPPATPQTVPPYSTPYSAPYSTPYPAQYPTTPYSVPYQQALPPMMPNDAYYNPYLPYQQAPAMEQYALNSYTNPHTAYNPYPAQPWMDYNYPPQEFQNPWQNQTDPQQALMQLLLQQEEQRHQQSLLAEGGGEQPNREEPSRKTPKPKDETETSSGQFGMNDLVPLKVSSPLGNTLISCAKTLSPFATPAGPHKGVGQPMDTRSWLDHPYYFGGFVGSISGSTLVSGLLEQKSGGHGGFMLGYNLNDYWGLESRLHFSSIDLKGTATASAQGLFSHSNQISVLDAAVHYYPLGNAKWRPFFKYGLGFARESFTDTYGNKVRINTAAMPLGVGLRYWWNEKLAIQMDLVDNMIFSAKGTKTQNNFAFTVGITYAFGTSKNKRPTVYWPYTPSRGSKW